MIRFVLSALALVAVASCAQAAPIYFTGTDGPTIWVGDTGGSAVAPAAALYSGVDANPPHGGIVGPVGVVESQGDLFWVTSRSTTVVKGAADGSTTPAALPNHHVVGGEVLLDVAIDRAGGRYFYSVTQGPAGVPGLYWANLDGSGSPTQIDIGVGSTGVAYDAASDYLYFVSNGLRISRVRPDGTGQEVIHDSSTDTFCDIALDSTTGRLYFTQSLQAVGVLDLQTLETTTLFDPEGTVRAIDIDRATQTLYWGAFDVNLNGDDAVQSGAADGTGGITTLYTGDFHNLRGLALGRAVPEPASGLLLVACAVACRVRRLV